MAALIERPAEATKNLLADISADKITANLRAARQQITLNEASSAAAAESSFIRGPNVSRVLVLSPNILREASDLKGHLANLAQKQQTRKKLFSRVDFLGFLAAARNSGLYFADIKSNFNFEKYSLFSMYICVGQDLVSDITHHLTFSVE